MKTQLARRNFIKIIGGGVVYAALPTIGGCSSSIPESAIEAWQTPKDSLETRKWILSYAILAPHSHNLQSWLVDMPGNNEIILYLDPLRTLPETDPNYRQIMMSHGTFLELLSIAAAERDLLANIELFPKGIQEPIIKGNQPIARVSLIKDLKVKRDPLFRQILRRHTDRGTYDQKEIDSRTRKKIISDVAHPELRINFTGNENALMQNKQRSIAKAAWQVELTTPRTILESYRLLRIGPKEINKYRDGISITSPTLRLINALGLFDRSKAPAPDDRGIRGQIEQFNQKLDTTTHFFSIISEGNDRITQIEAGRAYVRAQLSATAAGLSMHPLQQALQEYPEQNENYLTIHSLLDAPVERYTVQMWARIGYAKPVQPAPRLGLAHHIRSSV